MAINQRSGIPLVDRARQHGDRVAVIAQEGEFTYKQLLHASERVGSFLLKGTEDLHEERVAFLTPAGFDYAAVQWGIWRAGGIAVPLCTQHPVPELDYVIENARASTVVTHPEFEQRLRPLAEKRHLCLLRTDEFGGAAPGILPVIEAERRAMILYTSGTTSKPKGVVSTHRNITAQVATLVSAWEWAAADRTLHVLPLHHIHGIINILSCALWAGASCEMHRKFDPEETWSRLSTGEITVFMAVPTVYFRLITAWEAAPDAQRRARAEACRRVRLMVCGSAALPVGMLQKWRQISGHVLLERYGMTEIGMALSNPLRGGRIPGHVGTPLPGVQIRLVDEAGHPAADGQPGEIQVRGPSVFREYWNSPEVTRDSFLDGWFRTGDVAVVEDGAYRILGRSSVDIIKTGGYKVSALEIEEVLRAHPAIQECAVVGVEDPEWGERVCAALVLRDGHTLDLEALRRWAKERMAAYKVPSRVVFLGELPRNDIGKVRKPDVAKTFKA